MNDDNDNNDDDQELRNWGFTDEVCLKFYTTRTRNINAAEKIAAVKTALRLYVGTALKDFFTPVNLTSIFSAGGDTLATRLKPLLAFVNHWIAMGNPLPANSVSSFCSNSHGHLPVLLASLMRMTDRRRKDENGNPIRLPDGQDGGEWAMGESILDRLKQGGIDAKRFSGIFNNVKGKSEQFVNEIEQFLNSDAQVTYETLCAHLNAKGLLKKEIKERIAPGTGFTLTKVKAQYLIEAKSRQTQFADLLPDKETHTVLLDAVAACMEVAIQLSPDGGNPNMALVDAANHIWRYHTSKGQIYLRFTDDTFNTVGNIGRLAPEMTEQAVLESIRPPKTRKATEVNERGAGKKRRRKTQGNDAPEQQLISLPMEDATDEELIRLLLIDDAPEQELISLPPIMAQNNLIAEMARLEIKLPFYAQIRDQQTGQLQFHPETGQPQMEERWRDISELDGCGLALLFRQDPRFQAALQEPLNSQEWENSLFTLAGQVARLRNTIYFTPITDTGIEHHHLTSIAQERGLVTGDPHPLRAHNVNFLETAHQNRQYIQIQTTAAGATIGGMERRPNHFLQLEPGRTAEEWLLFDPLQRDTYHNPYLLPITADQVRAELREDNAIVTTISNADLLAQVQAQTPAPKLDADLDVEFLRHNPRYYDQELTTWGFTDEICLKFYSSKGRNTNSAQKIAAVKTALRPYVDTPLQAFFKPANLTSIFSGVGDTLDLRLKPLLAFVIHLIDMGTPSLPAEGVSSICSHSYIHLPEILAGLTRVTDRRRKHVNGNPIWLPDGQGGGEWAMGESILDRLNQVGIDGKSFSGIFHRVGSNFKSLLAFLMRVTDRPQSIGPNGHLLWFKDEHGNWRPQRNVSFLDRLKQVGIDGKHFSNIFHGIRGKFEPLFNEIEQFLNSDAQVNYQTLCVHLNTKGLLKKDIKESILQPWKKRKTAEGGEQSTGNNVPELQLISLPPMNDLPEQELISLPPIMAQDNLITEMARLQIKLPFYAQIRDPQTGQLQFDSETGQPQMEESWQDIRELDGCGLALLLRQDPRFQAALQEPLNSQEWENSLFTLAGQVARLRNSPISGLTPITNTGIEHHHLTLIAQERGLVTGDPHPFRAHNVNFLETAHRNREYIQIQTTAAGATIGGMVRPANHFLQLEPTETPGQWLLFDPLQRDANHNPYLLPITADQVRAELREDNAIVTTISNADLLAQVQAQAPAPKLDADLDVEFLWHNPSALSAVQIELAQQPLLPIDEELLDYLPDSPNDAKPPGHLHAATPPSIAPVEDWPATQKDLATPTAEAITHIVMQLEDDKTVSDAALNLYQRHEKSTRLLQINPVEGTAKQISPPTAAPVAEVLKVLLVAHSRLEGGGASTTETFGGQTAHSLAATLAPRLKQWQPAQVNIVGCKTHSFVIQFAATLRRHGVMTKVVGYDAWLTVDKDGRKRITTKEAEPQPARTVRVHIEPTDAIFEKTPEKDVVTANQLRHELLARTLDRRESSFLETILAKAKASQAFAQEHQILYFLEQCQDGTVFAGKKDGKGHLVYAAKAELHLSGIDTDLLQRGDKIAYTPGQPPLAAKASLRPYPSPLPEANSIPARSETKGVKRK